MQKKIKKKRCSVSLYPHQIKLLKAMDPTGMRMLSRGISEALAYAKMHAEEVKRGQIKARPNYH